MNTYNGWTNYETWCVNLWLTNEDTRWLDDLADEMLAELDGDTDAAVAELADYLAEQHDEAAPPEVKGVFADLLSTALKRVNWPEIARHFIDDAKERAEA